MCSSMGTKKKATLVAGFAEPRYQVPSMTALLLGALLLAACVGAHGVYLMPCVSGTTLVASGVGCWELYVQQRCVVAVL
jgi:hypothetical protein